MRKHDQISLQEAYNKIVTSCTQKNETQNIENVKKIAPNQKTSLTEIYEQVLEESKHINKKFARRYNRVTADLLKAAPGSKEYTKLKNERDDLVNILKDHGMTPADLDNLPSKQNNNGNEDTQEKSTTVEEEEVVCTTCGSDHNCKNCPEIGAH
jgi:uncharacterized protein YPO0396